MNEPMPLPPSRFWRRDAWREVWPRLQVVFITYPTQQAEVFAGLSAVLRGLWWMMAWDTPADRTSTVISHLIDSRLFGGVLLAGGLVQVLAVGLKSWVLRYVVAVMLLVMTMDVCVTSLIVQPRSLLVPFSGIIAVMELVIVLRNAPWTDYPLGAKRDHR